MQSYLTKSKYLNGLHCHKRLWTEAKHPERVAAPPESLQRIFDQGIEVGVQARGEFPEGVLVDTASSIDSVERTQEAIKSGASCIFEATFVYDDILVRCDILQKDSDSWRIIEVKASTKVKDEYLDDLAIQKYVLAGYGLIVSGTELMHINRDCVYPDLSDLFIIEDVTLEVEQLMSDVPSHVKAFKAILGDDVEPNVLIGNHCKSCPVKGYCWESVPERSIFTIPRISAAKVTELVAKDMLNLNALPTDYALTAKQRAYVDTVLSGQPDIDSDAIKRRLSTLQYPIHFLDFETYNPAVPEFDGLRPYQQYPFQYSCHIWQSDGVVTHCEYLHTDTTDPRSPFLKSLLNHISNEGSVVVYSAPFERKVLADLAQSFPKHSAALQSILSRLWDQLEIFKKHYKHPSFGGSNSLKKVLPVLVPSHGYQDLNTQDGVAAQAVWSLMIHTTSQAEKSVMISDLKAYCEMDTRAMVEIHKVLLRL